jgi:lipopolysaccharide biosynthesis regulator YciM
MSNPLEFALILVAVLILGIVIWLVFSRSEQAVRLPRGPADALELLLEGRDDEAKTLMAQLIRGGEAPPTIYLQMGRLLREEGDANRALSLHQGLLARRELPADLRRLIEVAIADDLLALGRYEEAETRLEKLDRRVLDADLLERHARALHRLGRKDYAAQRLEERARLAGGDTKRQCAAYLAELAREALRNGKPQTAGDYLHRSFKLDETLAAAYEVNGDRFMAMGRPDHAVRAWEEGLRKSRSGAQSFLPRLADAALRAGKMETLLAELERERDQRPQDIALWRAVTDLRLRRGDLESFFALVEDPPSPEAAGITTWAGWIRHLSRGENPQPLLRLLRSMPDSFAPRSYRCPECGYRDGEPRQACPECGALEALVAAEGDAPVLLAAVSETR